MTSKNKTCALLLVIIAAVLSFPANIAAAEKSERPNIVFVLVDDLRWDALGCTGHSLAKTPHIDRLAKEGALFKNFFVTHPLCSPARASFLTGQHSRTHGVTNNSQEHSQLSHKLVTFPRLLRDAGYHTAFVGKWHMGVDPSPRPGFDHWIGLPGQGLFNNPKININGTNTVLEGYVTDILNERAVEFVKQKRDKPFMLYLSHKAVHGPFTPAKRHEHLFADATLEPWPALKDTLEGKPAITREIPGEATRKKVNPQATVQNGVNREPPMSLIRAQLQCMVSIDEGVGMIYDALKQSSQLDNTVFVFTSDNGFFWREHGLGDKRWAYEEAIRVPLVIRYPKWIKPGRTPDELTLNIDVAPTFLELGNAPVPASMQGKSMVPLLQEKKAEWRSAAFFE